MPGKCSSSCIKGILLFLKKKKGAGKELQRRNAYIYQKIQKL
jgi:hypothetical protein